MNNTKIRICGFILCLVLLVGGFAIAGFEVDAPLRVYSSSVIAFVDVNVVPMDSERILERQTVIVHNGLIDRMGPQSEIDVPDGATIIEGKGRYLMPGIADMHVHSWSESDFVLFLANGITTIRNMWGAPQHIQWREAIEKGELLGPTLITAGPLLDGAPPIWEGSAVLETPEQARKTVIEQKKEGYDFIKVYNLLKPEVFDAIMEEAERQDIPVAGHVPDAVGLEHVLKSGMKANEHLSGYRELLQSDDSPYKEKQDYSSRIRRWNYQDESKIPGAIAATVDSDMWNCVTLVVYQGFVSPAAAEELFMQPEMKYVDPMIKESWDPAKDFRSKDLTEEDFKTLRKADGIRLKLTAALHKAGGRILLGTDTPNPFTIAGFSIHQELENLVAAGMTPFEAIKAGTKDAAEFQEDQSFGVVAPGKRADFILVEKNPLENVKHVKNKAGVMVRGRWLSENELQKMLNEVVASYKPPENRFKDIPALSVAGEEIFSGQYEMKFGKATLGEERMTVAKTVDGKNTVYAQAVTDPPYKALATMQLVFDDEGRCYSVTYKNETSTGKDNLRMIRDGTSLTISGILASGKEIDIKETVAEDMQLGASMTGSVLPLVQVARSLSVGEVREVVSKTMQMLPSFYISEESMTVKRADDGTRQTPAGVIPVQIFNIDVKSKAFPYNAVITLDKEGDLLEYEVKSQMGSMKFVRMK